MKYQDAPAFRQALERRLKERAAGEGARLALMPGCSRVVSRWTCVSQNGPG